MNEHLTCLECNEETLTPSLWEADFRHGEGQVHVTGLECYVCEQCGADPVFPDQIRRNHRLVSDAKRRSDGLLVSEEIRAIREQFGLSQPDAALLFGGGINAFSKYERGDVMQSVAMDRLLKATAFYPFLLDFLRIESQTTADGSGRVDVERYQAGAKLDMRDKAFGSRSLVGEIIQLGESAHWRAEAA